MARLWTTLTGTPVRRRLVGMLIGGLLAALVMGVTYCVAYRPRPLNCAALAKHYGRKNGLDPALVLAVIHAESSGKPKAVSRSGARGLMQLMWPTAKEVAGWEKVRLRSRDDLFDPDLNVRLGTRYLAWLRGRFGDDPHLYIAAYNAGPGNVGKWRRRHPGLASAALIQKAAFAETRTYVGRVLRKWRALR